MRTKVITRTIAVSGVLRRIGATTQSIQIVKYLNLVGYPSAYLEMSGHNFIDSCLAVYEEAVDYEGKGRVKLCDVDMYRSIQGIQKSGEEYAFLVKDYGSYDDKGFNQISFMEQDIKIFICGGKSDEIQFAEQVLRTGAYLDASYIFSFVPTDSQESISDFMDGCRSYFVEYTPDPFVYLANQNALYKAAVNLT